MATATRATPSIIDLRFMVRAPCCVIDGPWPPVLKASSLGSNCSILFHRCLERFIRLSYLSIEYDASFRRPDLALDHIEGLVLVVVQMPGAVRVFSVAAMR
jgi:hypothetical protein